MKMNLLVLCCFSSVLAVISIVYYTLFLESDSIIPKVVFLDEKPMYPFTRPVVREHITRYDEMLALMGRIPQDCLFSDPCRSKAYDAYIMDPKATTPSAPVYPEEFFSRLKQQSQRCQSDLKIAACVITRDNSDMLADFLIHHILIGVNFFFVTVHDTRDETEVILDQFAEHGFLEYTQAKGGGLQASLQIECLNHAANRTYDVATFMDTDERISPYEDFCFPKFLSRFQDVKKDGSFAAIVRLSWFISSPRRIIFEGSQTDPTYSALDPFNRKTFVAGKMNEHVKSTVFLRYVDKLTPMFPHWLNSMDSEYCSMSTNFRCKVSPFDYDFPTDLAVLAHARYRTFYSYLKKNDYGRPDTPDDPLIERSNLHRAVPMSDIISFIDERAVDDLDEALLKNVSGLGPDNNRKFIHFIEELDRVHKELYAEIFL